MTFLILLEWKRDKYAEIKFILIHTSNKIILFYYLDDKFNVNILFRLHRR